MGIYYYMMYISIQIYGQPIPGADPENFYREKRGGGSKPPTWKFDKRKKNINK